MAVKAGMDPFAALQAITINPAKHIGIADRVGSIEVGKDADLVLTDGCPFEVMTNVKSRSDQRRSGQPEIKSTAPM